MGSLVSKVRRVAAISCCLGAFLCLNSPSLSQADETEIRTFNTPRFTLFFDYAQSQEKDDGVFTQNIADRAIDILNRTADEYGRIFADRPLNKVVLKFLSPEQFRKQTGAPAWTSAMFYRGEISIPVVKSRGINFNELHRALRHEYVHAVIAELSDFRCPAWLDEGVAQMLEGQANPLLGPALRSWIKENEAMPLDWLQNGFTTLENKIVPAAYAQSLFATRTLVSVYGFPAVVTYLKALKVGLSESESFELAFGLEKSKFESTLTKQIKLWAESNSANP